ncbi:hypothetical protein N7488_012377 [Penicillium malachiteum]|nr:hypothetical protein N7488_012377 [Penicillium malachiteum]
MQDESPTGQWQSSRWHREMLSVDLSLGFVRADSLVDRVSHGPMRNFERQKLSNKNQYADESRCDLW